MKRSTILFLATVVAVAILAPAAAVAAGPQSVTDIPTALVVDTCRVYVDNDGEAPDVSQNSEVTMIDFADADPFPLYDLPVEEVDFWPSLNQHGGASFATLPGYERTHVFIAVGSKIKVYDVEDASYPDKVYDHLYEHENTINVGTLLGVSGFQVGRVAAGRWMGFVASPTQVFGQAALYVIGTIPGSDEAYWAVLDQQWLIEGSPPNGGTHLYGSGQICLAPGICEITQALDIRVGDLGDYESHSEEAYISTVQRFGSSEAQVYYRLERGLSATSFSLALEHGGAWGSPAASESAGLRFAPDSHDVYLSMKSPSVVRDVTQGVNSCVLDGEPVDVAVWEPGVGAESRYLLVPTWDGSKGYLEIFAPHDSGESCNEPVETISIGDGPSSIDLYPVSDDEVWALVVSRGSHLFEVIRLELDLQNGGFQFETTAYDMQWGVFDGSCPSFVHFGLRDKLWGPPYGGPGGLERKCLGENDPRCPPGGLRP